MGQEFAGILRERITILRQRGDRDGLGAAVAVEDPVGTFWAAAEALGSGPEAEAESRSATPRWRFILRETQAIAPGDRLVWGTREMTVTSVVLEHQQTPKTILRAEERR